MSKLLSNTTINGINSFRSFGPATASISALTFSTNRNKAVTLSVTNPVILREVSIYTQIGDYNHIDLNNRFQIIIATSSLAYGSYVGWQSSWNATASANYYISSNYTFSNLLSSTPIIQKIPLDILLSPGAYDFYLDETYNLYYGMDNLGYILTTTTSNYPYIDPSGSIRVIGTSSTMNQRGLTNSVGNIFFNWVVSDVEDVIIENGSLGLYNTTNSLKSSFSFLSGNNELVSIKNKPFSYTASFVISNVTSSNLLKIGEVTNINSYYKLNTGKVLMANSSNTGIWTTYSNANAISQSFNFWNTGNSICATASEGQIMSIQAPDGWVFVKVDFASYGLPNGTCSSFAISTSYHATSSVDKVSSLILGKNYATISATNDVFGDPAYSYHKRLYVRALFSSDFNYVTISNVYPSAPTYSYLANLNTSFSNNYTYQIIDNSSYSPVSASISFYDGNTNSVTSNYYAVISGTSSGGPNVAYPGWKIIII